MSKSRKIESDVIYSSQQWFHVLDTLIEIILEPLIEHTHLIEYYVSQLLVFQHTNKRKGVSYKYKWQEALSLLASFLSKPTIDKLSDIKLDRGFTQSMAFNFLDLTKEYETTFFQCFNAPFDARVLQEYEKLEDYHNRVKLKQKKDMLQLTYHVKHLFNEYLSVRDQILLNYYQYISDKAAYDANYVYKYSGVNKEDLHQNYYLAASKAINHYNKDKGTFKPYLDFWLMKARLTKKGSHFVPDWSKTELDESFLPPETFISELEQKMNSRSEFYKQIAFTIDPTGFLAASLGIHPVDKVPLNVA